MKKMVIIVLISCFNCFLISTFTEAKDLTISYKYTSTEEALILGTQLCWRTNPDLLIPDNPADFDWTSGDCIDIPASDREYVLQDFTPVTTTVFLAIRFKYLNHTYSPFTALMICTSDDDDFVFLPSSDINGDGKKDRISMTSKSKFLMIKSSEKYYGLTGYTALFDELFFGYGFLLQGDFDVIDGDFDFDGINDVVFIAYDGKLYIDKSSIPYSVTGKPFGHWDEVYSGYGVTNDYEHSSGHFDSDNLIDIIVRGGGKLYIDLGINGYGSWDKIYSGYGYSDSIMLNNDLDLDSIDDIILVGLDGKLYIDKSSIPNPDTGEAFGRWDQSFSGYGGINIKVDKFDEDNIDDIFMRAADGKIYIDYGVNGYGSWDETFSGYGGSDTILLIGDFDNDMIKDISLIGIDGKWYQDLSSVFYSVTGKRFGHWDNTFSGYGIPSTYSYRIDKYDEDSMSDIIVTFPDGIKHVDNSSNGYGKFDYNLYGLIFPNILRGGLALSFYFI